MNQSQALATLKKFEGVTPFIAAFVLQAGLNAHAIPLDATCLRAVHRLQLVREGTHSDEARASLERLVPKARGRAFSMLLRRLAFDVCLPEEPKIKRCVLAEICPTAQERLAKPAAKKKAATKQRTAPTRRSRTTATGRKHR